MSPEDDDEGVIYLSRRTRLALRLPQARIDDARSLEGETLDVAGHPIDVGAGQVHLLSPLTTLYARHIVATHPDLSAVVHSALEVRTDLWERRPRHADFLSLVVGYGRRELPVPLARHHEELDDEVVAALTGAGTFDGVSITVDLTGATVVGVCGERSAATGLVRSLVMQAAVHHGPPSPDGDQHGEGGRRPQQDEPASPADGPATARYRPQTSNAV